MHKVSVAPFSTTIHKSCLHKLGDEFPHLLRHDITRENFVEQWESRRDVHSTRHGPESAACHYGAVQQQREEDRINHSMRVV